MSEILIKESRMYGRMAGPGDKYVEPPDGPDEIHARFGYETIDKLLKEESKKQETPSYKRVINLPFIQQAVITPSAHFSYHLFKGYLVGNGLLPNSSWMGGLEHGLIVANLKEKEEKISSLLYHLKLEGSYYLRWLSFWEDKEDRIIKIPERIESMSQLLPEFRRIMLP